VPSSPSLVAVAGGGPAAIEAVLALRELAGDSVQIELIAPESELVVRAYEVSAPFHEGHEHRYPLERIAADFDLHLVRDRLVEVDACARTASLGSGAARRYDALVVAVGARHTDPLAGTIPFRGARDANKLKALLSESRSGRRRTIAFVIPGGHTWPIPVYELALNTSAWLRDRGVAGVPLAVISPEREPLAAFGSRASREVAALLNAHGVQFISGHAVRLDRGRLLLAGGRELDVDVAIGLTRLRGPAIHGLPSDDEGFVPVDELGRVEGVDHVFAAGDATTFPIKQGGLATQQADAIAASVAAALGAPVPEQQSRPVLRAVLFAGAERRYLYAELGENLNETSKASATPLWPDHSKVVGLYLAPYLNRLDEASSAAVAERPPTATGQDPGSSAAAARPPTATGQDPGSSAAAERPPPTTG
jgi:sulfide:quinone oxidoreductase